MRDNNSRNNLTDLYFLEFFIHRSLEDMKKSKKVRDGNSQTAEWKWLNMLKKQAVEFCRETGLHGYKYIVQTERSKSERIIWAIAVFVSLCCALVLMKFVWDYYNSRPIITVIESTHHGIWNYLFPAVTICDINRVSLNLTRTLVEKLKLPPNLNISKEFVIQEMRLLNELLYPGRYEYNIEKNLTQLQDIIDYNKLSIQTVLNLITRDCNDLLEVCKWKVDEAKCSKLFEKSFSRDGICCSFNYITFKDIEQLSKKKPKRITACGYQTGISVLVNFDPNDYHATISGSIGIKIMLHDPYDYPDHNAASKLIGMNKYAFLTVEPTEMYSKANIRNLAIPARNCIFSDEGDKIRKKNAGRNFLKAKYSFVNCMIECRVNVMKEQCGCIPYNYPQNETRICNLKDVACLGKYKYRYDTSWPGQNASFNTLLQSSFDINKKPCGCLPDCDFYRYRIEDSQASLDKTLYYDGLRYTKNPRGKVWKNHTIVHIFFGDLVSIQYRRNVHYNWRNLFASFGGFLGLFAGFSLMSVFEFIYFFVIRIITDLYSKRKNKENM